MEAERLQADSSSRSRRDYAQRRKFIWRNHLQGHQRLFLDYFVGPPVYPANLFWRRFRMRRSLFLRIQSEVEAHKSYFIQKRNSAWSARFIFPSKDNCSTRMLAYEVAADFMDEYLRIGESTTIKSLKKFVTTMVEIFSDEYLSSPTNNDIARLLAVGENRGFPGMLGSIDCMHWTWKNFPAAWKGMYTGPAAFFELPGSHNDINVLERSSVFTELVQGRAPPVNYTINGNEYTMGYYLPDSIYPQWATFVKTFPRPQGNKKKHFAMAQEACRKDVERAFWVLQARFSIVHRPARSLDLEALKVVMEACIILHNMIIEDEQDGNEAQDFDYEQIDEISHAQVSPESTIELMEFIERIIASERIIQSQLQSDLVEHLWQLYS